MNGDIAFFWVYSYVTAAYVLCVASAWPGAASAVRQVRFIDGDVVSIVDTSGLPRQFDFFVIDDVVYARTSFFGDNAMFAIEVDATATSPNPIQARRVPTAGAEVNAGISGAAVVPDANGAFEGNFAFGYSATLVRRVDPSAPNRAYNPIYIESPEIADRRGSAIEENAQPTDKANVSLTVELSTNYEHYGFTHVRIYRTTELAADNPDRRFLMDVPITGGTMNVIDDIPAGDLEGEMNHMTADQYSYPPDDGYRALYFKSRLFLLGSYGDLYFSEIPSGDGGDDLTLARPNLNKYALQFRPLHYRAELGKGDVVQATGIAGYGDDLYVFKANGVYLIVGGDPVQSPPRLISDSAGCVHGDTVTDVEVDGSESLFYLSTRGPMLIGTGGYINPFAAFKVRDLWPNSRSPLFERSEGAVEWCAAAYWNNTVWFMFKPAGCVTKIYGYYSAPDASGALEIKLAKLDNRYAINNLAITGDRRAVTFGNVFGEVDKVAFVDFLGSARPYDTFTDGEGVTSALPPILELISRRLYAGPLERHMSELYKLTAYCKFREDQLYNPPFILEVTNNRHKVTHDYYNRATNRHDSNMLLNRPVAGTLDGATFTRGDGGEWTAGALVGFAAYLYNGGDPYRGKWVNVADNSSGVLTFDVEVEGDYNRVRFIARPHIRESVQFVPRADFVGGFFQYKLTKAIPLNFDFHWYGAELEVIPKPQLELEEYVGSGELETMGADGYEVVETPFPQRDTVVRNFRPCRVYVGAACVTSVKVTVEAEPEPVIVTPVYVGVGGITSVTVSVEAEPFTVTTPVYVGVGGVTAVTTTVASAPGAVLSVPVFVGAGGVTSVTMSVEPSAAVYVETGGASFHIVESGENALMLVETGGVV